MDRGEVVHQHLDILLDRRIVEMLRDARHQLQCQCVRQLVQLCQKYAIVVQVVQKVEVLELLEQQIQRALADAVRNGLVEMERDVARVQPETMHADLHVEHVCLERCQLVRLVLGYDFRAVEGRFGPVDQRQLLVNQVELLEHRRRVLGAVDVEDPVQYTVQLCLHNEKRRVCLRSHWLGFEARVMQIFVVAVLGQWHSGESAHYQGLPAQFQRSGSVIATEIPPTPLTKLNLQHGQRRVFQRVGRIDSKSIRTHHRLRDDVAIQQIELVGGGEVDLESAQNLQPDYPVRLVFAIRCQQLSRGDEPIMMQAVGMLFVLEKLQIRNVVLDDGAGKNHDGARHDGKQQRDVQGIDLRDGLLEREQLPERFVLEFERRCMDGMGLIDGVGKEKINKEINDRSGR